MNEAIFSSCFNNKQISVKNICMFLDYLIHTATYDGDVSFPMADTTEIVRSMTSSGEEALSFHRIVNFFSTAAERHKKQ